MQVNVDGFIMKTADLPPPPRAVESLAHPLLRDKFAQIHAYDGVETRNVQGWPTVY